MDNPLSLNTRSPGGLSEPSRTAQFPRPVRPGAARLLTTLCAVLLTLVWASPLHAQSSGPSIADILEAKARRTPAQRKVSSQLLDAAASAQQARDARDEVVTVDIRADVTKALLARIRVLGGTVINSVPKYRAIRAELPVVAIERLAALAAVQTIRPADEARTRKEDTTEGDHAHRTNTARATHGVNGMGIGIGVISNGVRTLADRQASDDVPAQVTVLPGQAGLGDEGTALLEIIHDLAPEADLYFATGLGGEARMAENIEALCEAGANVIVDDIGYSLEAVFQDGIIAQGVNAAVTDGCFFFSAGGNDGNLTNGTSSVWEGDYAAGSTLVVDGETLGVRHDFGGGVEANAVSTYGEGAIVLQWADPLGVSTNDYDLFVINEDGDVIESSTNTQDGTQDPIESIPHVHLSGRSVVVVRVSGVDRYLRVQAFGGRLAVATAGNMYGHPAAENAIGVAMVNVRTAAGTDGVFNGNESVRTDNSDGPRRIFFQPDGTAITAGNFSSTGGQLLKKPDLAAATCVSTATPGFSTFCGTSSAAPHAAAIAALMLEAAGGPNEVTLAELRTGMTTGTAVLDIEATGVDRDSGAGIVMAPGAVDAVDVAEADRNGAPTVENAESDRTLAPGDDAVDIDLEDVFDDPDDDTLTYEAISSDPDRLTITRSNAQVTLTPVSPGRVVVRLRAIDPDGLSAVDSFSVTVTAGNKDYDLDNDGLIDVANLAQLDALRYDLNGDGLVDGATWMPYYRAFPSGALGMGCPPIYGCIGYELTANLDFDTDGDGDIDSDDTYWNDGKGWAPIGSSDDPFIVRFYGNSHSLTNLFINRPDEDEIGLFGQLGPIPPSGLSGPDVEATDLGFDILDVGLIGVDISGRDRVGSLAGRADGSETRRSHASGRVAGRDRVGGLVGESESGVWQSYAAVKVSGRNSVGGLIGSQSTTKVLNFVSHSRIGVCYATGDVSGANAVGGLVGSSGVWIRAVYATGNVSGTGSRQMGASECELGGGGVGGLVGNACYPKRFGGHIFASYAMGMVSGSVGVGGLVGTTHSEVLFWNNYWDMEASGVRVGVGEDDSNKNGVIDGTESHSIGLAGRTTAVLQAPTDYEGIYETWNLDITLDGEPDAPWHFGTSSQYPALTADLNENGSATWQEFGYQVRGGLTLTATTTASQAQVVLSWNEVSTSPWSPAPDVTYTLARDDGTTEVAVEKGTTALRYTDTDVTTGATYTYRVTALFDGGEAIRSAPVSVIAGEGNQPPVAVGILEDLFLRVGAGTGTVALSGAFRDPDSDTLTYGASSSETAVATVTSSAAQLTIIPVAAGRAAITVTATDAAGSNNAATQRFTVTVWPANAVDYDTDDDNLIEIGNLAQLDAVRHDLDGDGTPTTDGEISYDTAFANALERMGCSLSVGCRGYELTEDLDFDTDGNGAADAADEYWNGGAGWVPIGGAGTTLDAGLYDLENPFTAIFEGNGHTVSHLFIETDTILLVGLFGYAESSSNIQNLGLIDADVSGPELAAGLVGFNNGEIRGSYVTGRVSGIENVGGLVGINSTFGEILGSYATSHVSGDDDVGGLVGDNRGDIFASYATGRAAGDTDVGGLIGNNKSTGEISASYATGTVSGGSDVGGLIGLFEGGSINASYWDKQTSGDSTGVLPFGRTTAQLQSPVDYTGIYAQWNVDLDGDGTNDDPWDFGMDDEYPVLAVDFDGDGDPTWQEFGYQLRAGPSDLTATIPAGSTEVVLSWTAVTTDHWDSEPDVTYTVIRDDGSMVEVIDEALSETTATDTAVPAGMPSYQVAAVVDGGEGTRSGPVTVTVTDDERPSTAVNLSVNPAGVQEDRPEQVTVTGTLNGAPKQYDTVVRVTVTADTADLDDFDAVSPFDLTIAADAERGTATFTLTPTDDDIDEPDETVTVDGSATVRDGATTVERLDVNGTTVRIRDNDDPPTVRLKLSPDSISEGETTTLTAELSHPSSAATEVTVTEPPDTFELDINPLRIEPGKTMGSATLTAVDNDLDARDRQVTVTGVVDNVQGVGQLEATTLTITDDDPPVVSGDTTKEYTEHAPTLVVATYTATNPAGVTLAWSVSEPDADDFFRIDQNGVLHFKQSPDFEASRGSVYQVTVEASDSSRPGERPGTLDVTVTVADALGKVDLPPTAPRIGTAFTATLDDPDEVDEDKGIQWCWERSLSRSFLPADTRVSHCDSTTTATYTPGEADRDRFLRVTATYTDRGGTTNKTVMKVSADLVSDRRPPPPPPRPPPGPGPGPGPGGGGPACAEDVHGNTSTQATAIALSAMTAGAICPAADVDYFTLTVPGRGLVFVDTTGGVNTRGTLWQDGAVLASGSTSRQPDDRLGALVQAGTVVVAVQGQGGATGDYDVVVTFTPGYLENPGPESFQSGVGVLSGWVCDADMVEIELNGVPQEAAYGTERLDTAGVCGDVDNGFGLLVNWNRLGAGEHTVVAYVDGVELGRATVRVTTVGAGAEEEFLRGAAGTCEAEDFPRLGERVTLVWQQPSQNFVIAGGSAPVGVNRAGVAGVGYLENPGPDSFQSGVGVISGWVCAAALVEVALNGVLQEAAYGTERLDTQAVCGDVDNGFGLLVNWNRLGEGEHTVVAYVDGVELGRATVRVTTVGAGAEEEFLRGVEGACVVEDFPRLGQSVLLEWQQNSQNFVITDIE